MKKTKNNDNLFLFLLASIKFLIHLLTGWQYGYFRDELYYFSMSEHLDLGYVDITPLVAWLMKLSRILLGDSVFAIHILPALAGALTVLLAGLIARKLGGGRYAQVLTAVAVIAAPLFQIFNAMFTYDCFDQLLSALLIYVLVWILTEKKRPQLWLLFGVVVGIGLMTKISMLFLGFSLIVALLLTKERKYFTTKWIWLAGLIALGFLLPYLWWQASHHWIILEYWGNYAQGKAFKANPIEFLLMEMIVLNPLSLPLWLGGLYYLLFAKKGSSFKVLGWLNLVYLFLAIIMSFKFYILAGSFFGVLAAGAVWVEKYFIKKRSRSLRYAYPIILFGVGLLFLPLTVPVLPIEQFVKFNNFANNLGVNKVKAENIETAELPQHFADRFGWEELVRTVAKVYQHLPPAEQEKCAIFANNYGEAGAIDLIGKKYGLPKAISGHLSFYVWGPRDYTGEVMLIIGFDRAAETKLREVFEEVEIVAITEAKYAMPYENHQPIYLCKKAKLSMPELWPMVKNLN